MNLEFSLAELALIISAIIWAADYWHFEPKRKQDNKNKSAEEIKDPLIFMLARLVFIFSLVLVVIRFSPDFSLVLAIAIIVSGTIWAADKWFFASRRIQKYEQEKHQGIESEIVEPPVVEFSRFIFPVVLIVFILRGFIAEPFRIPSGSMLPTLEVGDFILVSKFNYGVRLPVINKKIIELGNPERGDVVVFRYPENPSIDYIKRVIGVPGDEIGYYNKVLYINGKMAEQQPIGDYAAGFYNFKRITEKLPDPELDHNILVSDLQAASDFVLVVPAKSYFVMGDNRDNSRDSRVWGFVPDENLVGRAFFVWMSWEWKHWPKWHRVGSVIR